MDWNNRDKKVLTSQSFQKEPKKEEVDTISMITDIQNQMYEILDRLAKIEKRLSDNGM